MQQPTCLMYDIETSLSGAWLFSFGHKTRVNINNLANFPDNTLIMCISYVLFKWPKQSSERVPTNAVIEKGILKFDLEQYDDYQLIKDFDELITRVNPDIIIGKNNARFDDKHVNARALYHGYVMKNTLPKHTKDLQTAVSSVNNLLSQKLEYISKTFLKHEGKAVITGTDWKNIVESGVVSVWDIKKHGSYRKAREVKLKIGQQSFDKMCKYALQDSMIQVRVLFRVFDHVPVLARLDKYRAGATIKELEACEKCGSMNIKKNGKRIVGAGVYQTWFCNDGYHGAGKTLIGKRK